MKTISINQFATKGMLLLTLLSLTSVVAAQYRAGRGAAGGWQHLGEAHVDGRADHDKIQVNSGPFTALELGVTSGAIGFERIVVHFREGEMKYFLSVRWFAPAVGPVRFRFAAAHVRSGMSRSGTKKENITKASQESICLEGDKSKSRGILHFSSCVF